MSKKNETVKQFVARILAAQKLRNGSQQLAKAIEPSRRTIETLTAQLNAHEERLNRRMVTSETMAFKVQIKISKTNNGDDKKKRRMITGRRKSNASDAERKNILPETVITRKTMDSSNKKEEAYCSFLDMTVNTDYWIVDSGASCHMTSHREWFVDYEPYAVPVNVANGNQVLSEGRSTILIRSLVENEWSNLRLINVLHVPSLDRNLFSTRKIVEKGCKIIGDAKTIKFEKNGRIVMMAVIRDGVFVC